MDIRNGDTYPTVEAALDAGVPASDIAHVTPGKPGEGPTVRFASGPFKNRVYLRDERGNLVLIGEVQK